MSLTDWLRKVFCGHRLNKLRQKISNLQKRNNELSGEVDRLKKENKDLESKVESFQRFVTDIQRGKIL